jgi:hypothetical protein
MNEINMVEVRGGIAEVTSGDVLVIDWDNEMDYDTAASIISELLNSDLDGPSQMHYISMVIEEFNKFCEARGVK